MINKQEGETDLQFQGRVEAARRKNLLDLPGSSIQFIRLPGDQYAHEVMPPSLAKPPG